MAHPYAPMGGSYDDRVVGVVLDEFLKAGWIVGTFNFRYALIRMPCMSWSER
jgi:alpha/beta superfamily hydrolase